MDILDKTILNIFNLPFPDINKNKNNIPNDLFGLFVTVKRFNKLSKWPEDIHGCIGYWDTNYKTLSTTTIYDKIMSVSKDAMYNDNRRTYFPSILDDPLSTIEISYMKQPLYEINPDTGFITSMGIQFNNNKFGLIIDNMKGNRATYLPKVFNNITWSEIKQSIANKAGSSSNSLSQTFYAYKTKTIEKSLFSLLFNPSIPDKIQNYPKQLISTFCDMVNDYYKQGIIPFSISPSPNNKIIENRNELIRNTSVIDVYLKGTRKRSINRKILEYLISGLNTGDEQAIANIISLFIDFGYNDLIKESDIKKLIAKIPKAEPKFERPQILICLIKYNKYDYNVVMEYLDKIDKSDVFMLNWYSQVLQTIGNIKIITKPAISLMNMFLELNKNKKLSLYETNYLAVIFEGMMNLVYILSKANNNIYRNGLSLIFKVFLELMNRYNPRTGTFMFLSGESRLDISCHVFGGLLLS